jgi:hypothetical protein
LGDVLSRLHFKHVARDLDKAFQLDNTEKPHRVRPNEPKCTNPLAGDRKKDVVPGRSSVRAFFRRDLRFKANESFVTNLSSCDPDSSIPR